MRNKDFEHWDGGTSTDPEETGVTPKWRRSDNANLAAAREGTTVHGGTYAGKYTPADATNYHIFQDLTSHLLGFVRGRRITASIWVKLTTARDDNIHMSIDHSNTTLGLAEQDSSEKAADTNWEQLTVSSLLLNNNPTDFLQFKLHVNDPTTGASQAFYVDDASLTIDAENYA